MRKTIFAAISLFMGSAALSVATDTSVLGGVHPALSPDGLEVALSYQGEIWKQSVRDGSMLRLTQAGVWDIEPAWSPDGKRIAFFRGQNFHGGELLLIDSTSGEDIAIPKKIHGEGKLSFSPDGKRLFGILNDGKFSQQFAWVDLATGDTTRLKIGPDESSSIRRKRMKAAVSPDGKSLVYAVHRDEADEQGGNRSPKCDVWTCNAADGSNPRKQFVWPARIYDVTFDRKNKDGQSLLIVTDLGTAHNDIWRVPLSETLQGSEKITYSQTDDDRPSLDASGDLLLWSDNSAGATALRLLNRSTGETKGLAVNRRDFRSPTGTLKLQLADASTGKPVTARVSVQRLKKDGSKGSGIVAPSDAMYRLTGAVGHFYAQREAEFECPVGEYEIQVFHGPEYSVWRKKIKIEETKTLEVGVELQRWTDQAKAGWYSGENHVHANYGYGEWYNSPKTILRQCQGENLNVCNAVIANSDGEAVFDREFFLGQVDPHSTDDTIMYWGQEFRATLWGHMTLSNITQLVEPIMTGFKGTTNPWDVPTNGDIAQRVLDQNALVSYTHPAGNRLDLYNQPYSAKGVPVDAALGKVLLMDVMGHTYDGGSQLWYKLMNCGLRVFASSGTDVFLNRVRSMPPGWARTYVHLPNGLTYADWTKGQQMGHSFITNGPMLSFEVDGLAMGSEKKLNAPDKIKVKAGAKFQFQMDRVEIIHNGNVVKSLELSADKLNANFHGEIEISESGWLALRAHGSGVSEVIREPNAHTNPVWIEVSGKPNTNTKSDAAYFLKWIDRLESDFRKRERWPSDSMKEYVFRQLQEARKYYLTLAGA